MTGHLGDFNEQRAYAGVDRAADAGAALDVEIVTYLGRGQIGETWLGRRQGGVLVAAKRLRSGIAGEAGDLEALRGLSRLRDPQLAAVLRAEPCGGRTWVLSEVMEGVTLRRLLAVTSLSPGQWVVIARSVLGGLGVLHGHGLVHAALHAGNVYVGPDGVVRLADGGLALPRPAPAQLEALRSADLSVAWSLLMTAAAGARRRQAWPVALAALLVDDPPAADAPSAALAVLETAGEMGAAEATARAREQLGALAGPLLRGRGTTLASGTGAVAGGASPPPERSTAPSSGWQAARTGAPHPGPGGGPGVPGGRTARRHRHRRSRPLAGIAAASVAAVLAVTLVVVHVLSGASPAVPRSGTGPPRTAHRPAPAPSEPGPSPAPPTPSPAATLPALPVLAPPSAGDVSGVVIQPLSGTCSPGAPCTLAVRVDLSAHHQEMVGWVLEIIDRCTGSRTEFAVRPMVAPASFLYVYSPTTVVVPATSLSAIVALTTLPSQAASQPLLVQPEGASCAV
jgi:Protein tyrosine and serine/threonine kinase